MNYSFFLFHGVHFLVLFEIILVITLYFNNDVLTFDSYLPALHSYFVQFVYTTFYVKNNSTIPFFFL